MTRIFGSGGGNSSSSRSGSTPDIDKDNLESTQNATIIDLISEGEIEGIVGGLKGVFFDETPLKAQNGDSNFPGMQTHERNGTQNQEYIKFPLGEKEREGTESPSNVGVLFDTKNQAEIRRVTSNTNVDAIRVTINIPQLTRIEKDGDQRGAQIEISFRLSYDSADYVEVKVDDIRGRTTNPYQRDYVFKLDSFNTSVDMKVTRVTDSAADKQSDGDFQQYANDFVWASFAEITQAKLAYPNSALFGARFDASQFSNVPKRKYRVRGIKVRVPNNAVVDSASGRITYSSVWNGTFGAATWTSDPAWILWDLLTSTRYGFGDHVLTAAEKASFTGNASKLDKFAFFAASQYCGELVSDGFGGFEPRFSCNVNIQTSEGAYKLINDMCSVFRAMPFWAAGAVTVAQDKPTDAAYAFTLANVSAEGFSYSGASRKNRPTVAVVSYLDLQQRDVAYEYVEDSEAVEKWGVVKREVSAFACTSRGQAARIGEWLLYSERYEAETVTFTTSIDAGVVVRPGQVIKISDPVKADKRRGGRIVSATTTAVTVDDATDVPTASVHRVLNVILSDGSLEQRTVSSVVGNVITVSSAFSSAPNANSIWVLGTTDIQTSTWRVIGVSEGEGAEYFVTAVSYNASKYDFIENNVELTSRDITNLNIIPEAPSGLQVEEVLYESNGIARVKLLVGWNNVADAKQYRVEWREQDGNWQIFSQGGVTYELHDYKPGTYEFKVYSLSASLITSPSPAEASYVAFAKTSPPEDVAGLSLISSSPTTAILSWTRATALDVLLGGKVLIRHSRATQNAVWDESQSIVAAAAGSQTQKQVPLLEGTYLLKFEDDTGNKSANATTFAVDFPEPQPLLLVESYREDQTYLTLVDDMGTWDSLGNIDSITSPIFSGTGTNMAYDSGLDGLTLTNTALVTGEYEFDRIIDLGSVFDMRIKRHLATRGYLASSTLWDSRTDNVDDWSTIDLTNNLVDNTDAALYVRATNSDPGTSPTFGPWREFSNAIVRGRAFQFKVIATAQVKAENIIIDELGATFELDQRVEAVGPLNSSNGALTSVTFGKPFYAAPIVTVVGYNTDAGATVSVGNVTRNGFEVEFLYDGVIKEHAFNYVAVGFGKEIT